MSELQLKDNLLALMSAHGVRSGTQLARLLNLPAPTVNRLLSGAVQDPRLSTLMRVANHFKVTLDELIGRHC